MKPFDILAIGELNVDLILTGMSSLPIPGRELIAETCTLTMGSSTAICAAGMAGLGLKTAFTGKVGKDGVQRSDVFLDGAIHVVQAEADHHQIRVAGKDILFQPLQAVGRVVAADAGVDDADRCAGKELIEPDAQPGGIRFFGHIMGFPVAV